MVASAKFSASSAVPQTGFSTPSVHRKPRLKHYHTWPQDSLRRSQQTPLTTSSTPIGRKRPASAVTDLLDSDQPERDAFPDKELSESKHNHRGPKRVKPNVLPMSPPPTPSKSLERRPNSPAGLATPPTPTPDPVLLSPPKSPAALRIFNSDIVEEATITSDLTTVPTSATRLQTPDKPFLSHKESADELSS